MQIVDGWLKAEDGDPVIAQARTAKNSALSVPQPLAVVWHWTGYIGQAAADYWRAYAAATRDERSANAAVMRDGSIFQLVSFLRASWHVGRKGIVGGREVSINGTCVGIELENAGRLKKVNGIWRYFSGGQWRGEIPEAEVIQIPGIGAFQRYTDVQIASAAALLGALAAAYGWAEDACTYGHIDFAKAGTREDPGPAWGCHRWPDGQALRDVIDQAFLGATPTLGLPTFCDDSPDDGEMCGATAADLEAPAEEVR